MRGTLLTLLWTVLFVSSGLAQSIVQPSVDLTAENVISIQLKALSDAENDPARDSGVAQVWAFAHPSNRAMTGPLSRFTRMLKSPNYRALIGHRDHFLRLVKETKDKAHFAVRVTGQDGWVYGYSWQLAKVPEGAFADMWMTTTVVLAGRLGRAT